MEAESYPTSIAELTGWRKANNTTTEEARRRLVQFVVLASIASSTELVSRLALKGGNALRFMHGNSRSTADLDFSAEEAFPDKAEEITQLFDTALKRAERQFQVKARCLSVHRNPKNPEKTLPTYAVNVCYQIAGDKQYQNFEQRRNLPIVEIEISINDILCETFEKQLSPETNSIRVCTLEDIIAEKLRALLQQPIRNRSRPQDVYDIASRLREFGEKIDLTKVSAFLLKKATARGISARKSSFDEKVRVLAMANYDEEIKVQATVFISFDEAWNELILFVSILSIPE